MKRLVTLTVVLLALLLVLVACADKDNVAGKTYLYEGEGCGGYFTITLNDDSTFSYYEGMLSSYIGYGTWTLEKGVLCLTDTMGCDFINYFKVENGKLIFLEETSTNFLYVKVADGECFRVVRGTGTQILPE